MEVIGRKKHGIAWGYLFCLAFLILCLVVLLVFSDGGLQIPAIVLVSVAFIFALVLFILYLKAPENPITYNQTDAIYINGKKINLIDILDVSYTKSSYRLVTFEFGIITVQTKAQAYRAHYVENCESVCKVLTKLVYDSKNKGQQ